jgi:PBP1b-binding outer membrane lipoprotein LpoB
MRRSLMLLVCGALVLCGCAKKEAKPITSEADMRKATDEMVKRQMGGMAPPMAQPGAGEPGSSK